SPGTASRSTSGHGATSCGWRPMPWSPPASRPRALPTTSSSVRSRSRRSAGLTSPRPCVKIRTRSSLDPMASPYDLVIRNGIVVDGTGLPRRRADVAVKDGRVAEIGFVDEAGRRELDASGRVVAPGFVDPHTHYDPQLTFEPYATSSCYHGVTTVVAGNCGFSVAPLRPGDSPWLIQLFARVEGMDASALEGIPFDGFETFPEYLEHMRGRLGINAAFYVGHCAVRRYVMGDECQE